MFVAGICLVFATSKPSLYSSVEESQPRLVAPENMNLFSLGYSQILADSFWIRIIQDFDFCENRPKGVYDPRKFKCEKGWVFQMISSVIELDPLFRQAHLYGALMLTVIVNDIEGASAIFDKATARFPTDWEILYAASYQAMVEEKNLPKASRLLNEAGQHGAPVWTRSLAARLQQKAGQLELAKAILESAVNNATDEHSAELFRQRLSEVDKEIAKQKAADATAGAPEKITK